MLILVVFVCCLLCAVVLFGVVRLLMFCFCLFVCFVCVSLYVCFCIVDFVSFCLCLCFVLSEL